MNPELKKEWIRQLRSGNYKQGAEYLHRVKAGRERKDRFCCLGVLCDILVKRTVPEVEDLVVTVAPDPGYTEGSKLVSYAYDGGGDDMALTRKLEDALGIDKFEVNKLMEMNDSGKSFKAIADYIETSEVI